MKKQYIILSLILTFALMFLGKTFAGLFVTEDMKVPGINFNGRTVEMTILKDSETGSFLAANGSFKVTNPTSKNGFNIASADSEVKSILLTRENGKVVSCALNENPGQSFLHINGLKGTYNIVPSKIEDCSKALEKSAAISSILEDCSSDKDIAAASFLEDMSPAERAILLEVAKIAAFVIIGQVI